MRQFWNRWRTLLVAAVLAASTLAVFWPVIGAQFIDYDDPNYVTDNLHVKSGISWQNVAWAFRTGEASNWHPLTWVSHQLDSQLFDLHPAGHHLTNLLLHVVNTLLLFLLLKRMTRAFWPSALVAALFALHPLHVESVAWVAERKDVLSTSFALLCLLAYGRYVEGGRAAGRAKSEGRNPKAEGSPKSDGRNVIGWYVLALLLFSLGLMSKPMLVTLPVLMLLLDFWPLGRFDSATALPKVQSSKFKVQGSKFPLLVLEKIPFLGLAAVSILITLRVQSRGGAVSSMGDLPLAGRVANALASYLKYLAKAFWPTDLAVFYPHPSLDHSQWPTWQIVAAGLVLAGISVLAWLLRRRQPWFALGWFWFLVTLLPVIGLVQAGSQAMADRYTYIPLIGIFISIAWTFSSSSASAFGSSSSSFSSSSSIFLPRFLAATAILTIAACALVTRHQVAYWHDDSALFNHALTVNERNAPAHTILGQAYARAGKLGFALVHCRAATQADPGFAHAWQALGDAYDVVGQPRRAVGCYQTALRLSPDVSHTWFRLGCVYAALGKLTDAVQSYQTALRLNPDFDAAHNNLATALWSLGNRTEGLKEFAEAVRLNPVSPEKRYNYGLALAEAGKSDESARQLAEAVRLKPDYAAARSALAGLGSQTGNYADAQNWFREMVRQSPNDPSARVKLGGALLLGGQTQGAEAELAEARRLDPQFARKSLEMGAALARSGQQDAAIGSFMAAAWLEPHNAEAHRQLGLLLARAGKLEEAISHLEQALHLAPGADAHYHLGLVLAMKGKLREAVGHYEEALKLMPDLPPALNDLAWIYATAPQPELRNGAEAVRLAERACQINAQPNAAFLGTLAAAYAEAGRFADAVKTAENARNAARAAGDKSAAESAEARLELYRTGKPYRQ